MAVVLAIGCAVVYGASDFLGGLASRRTSVFGVVAFSQLAGLVALVALPGPRLGYRSVASSRPFPASSLPFSRRPPGGVRRGC